VLAVASRHGATNLRVYGSIATGHEHERSYLDLLVDLLLVRRLPPWHRNAGKRLVKSPKIFVRDSGIVHALLGLGTKEQLLGHPVALLENAHPNPKLTTPADLIHMEFLLTREASLR
jgi:predicted AAA+ superfamily ATPase